MYLFIIYQYSIWLWEKSINIKQNNSTLGEKTIIIIYFYLIRISSKVIDFQINTFIVNTVILK